MQELFSLIGRIALDGTAAVLREVDRVKASYDKASEGSKQLASNLDRLDSVVTQNAEGLRLAGTAIAGFGAAVGAALVGVTSAAIGFESAFTGVRRTVDGSVADLDIVRDQMLRLSEVIPVAANDLASIAEIGGQLGVSKENIVAFTSTIADLSVATNLTADAGADFLARFTNIMSDVDESKFRNIGSAINLLGQSAASSESDIAAMAIRIAGAANAAGLTTPEVLGMATALSDVGLQAEAGGTALQKIIIRFAAAAKQGGEDLDKLAAAAGLTGAELQTAFQERGSKAIELFLQGLAKTVESGGDVFSVLEDLDIEQANLTRTILSASAAADKFSGHISNAGKEMATNTSLTRDAETAYKTTENQIKLLGNSISRLAIEIGTQALPAVSAFVAGTRPVVQWATEVVKEFPLATQAVLGLSAAFAGASVPVGGFLLLLPNLIAGIKQLQTLAPLLASSLGKGAGIAGVIAVGIVQFSLLQDVLDRLGAKMNEVLGTGGIAAQNAKTQELIWPAIKNVASEAVDAIINKLSGLNEAAKNAEGVWGKLANTVNAAWFLMKHAALENSKEQEEVMQGLATDVEDLGNRITEAVRKQFTPTAAFANQLKEEVALSFDLAADGATSLKKALENFGVELRKTPRELAAMAKELAALKALYKEGKISLESLEKAQKTYDEAVAGGAKNLEKAKEHQKEILNSFRDTIFPLINLTERMQDYNIVTNQTFAEDKLRAIRDANIALNVLTEEVMEPLGTVAIDVSSSMEALGGVLEVLAKNAGELDPQFDKLTEAFRAVGLETSAERRANIEKYYKAYEEARKALDGTEESLKNLKTAQVAYEKELGKGIEKTETFGDVLKNQVSNILNDVAKDIAKIVIEGGKLSKVFDSVKEAILRVVAEAVLGKLIKGLFQVISTIPGLKGVMGSLGLGGGGGGTTSGTANLGAADDWGFGVGAGTGSWFSKPVFAGLDPVSIGVLAFTATSTLTGWLKNKGKDKTADTEIANRGFAEMDKILNEYDSGARTGTTSIGVFLEETWTWMVNNFIRPESAQTQHPFYMMRVNRFLAITKGKGGPDDVAKEETPTKEWWEGTPYDPAFTKAPLQKPGTFTPNQNQIDFATKIVNSIKTAGGRLLALAQKAMDAGLPVDDIFNAILLITQSTDNWMARINTGDITEDFLGIISEQLDNLDVLSDKLGDAFEGSSDEIIRAGSVATDALGKQLNTIGEGLNEFGQAIADGKLLPDLADVFLGDIERGWGDLKGALESARDAFIEAGGSVNSEFVQWINTLIEIVAGAEQSAEEIFTGIPSSNRAGKGRGGNSQGFVSTPFDPTMDRIVQGSISGGTYGQRTQLTTFALTQPGQAESWDLSRFDFEVVQILKEIRQGVYERKLFIVDDKKLGELSNEELAEGSFR